jgi:uncharacterized membrane protein YidH (DUF202 family)
MKAIGLVLVIIGLVGLVYGGIQWTTREKVVDFGPVEVTHQEKKSVPIPPIAGAVCVVAGAIILAAGRRS